MCPEDLVATSQKEIVNVLQNPDSLSWSIDDSLLPKRVAPTSLSTRSPAVQLEEEKEQLSPPPVNILPYILLLVLSYVCVHLFSYLFRV